MDAATTGTRAHRKYPRREMPRTIGVLCMGQYMIVSGIDIGEGGLSFQSEFLMGMEKTVVLTFQIPNGEMVSVTATIRNQRQVDERVLTGVSFNALTFTYKRQIRYYVSSRAEGTYIPGND